MKEVGTKVDPVRACSDQAFYFTDGNKILTLRIDGDQTASTLLDTGLGRRKVGSTRRLYGEAKDKLQQTADSRGYSISYVFKTLVSVMKDWARTHGQTIFNWDLVLEESGTLSAFKTFTPCKGTRK